MLASDQNSRASMTEHQYSPHEQISLVADTYSKPQRFAWVWLGAAISLTMLLMGLSLARGGTPAVRVAGGALIVATGVVMCAFVWRWRRRMGDSNFWFHEALVRLDAELAGKVTRAYRLLRGDAAKSQSGGASRALVELHATRMLSQISLKQVALAAHARRLGFLRAAWLLMGLSVACLVVWPLFFLEGLDVLFAKRGVGPISLSYVEDISLTAEWPSYLDGTGEKRRLSLDFGSVPEGAEIEVRVLPRVAGRQLLLTDGVKRVPLVSDGQGAMVARWIADDPAGLKVAAQFGDVLLYDTRSTRLEPLSDLAPIVRLADAPKTLQLSEVERLELTFVASDDHGLAQVDLVLSSGQRTVRTELARLDAQTRVYRGGHALTREHELLRRAFLPVHVRVEARDGNTATGPTWGKSHEIILLPEPLGKAVAQRHLALREFRKEVSAFVAADHEAGYVSLETRKEAEQAAHAKLRQALVELQSRLETDPALPRRSLSFLSAQVEALERSGSERATPEAVLLAVDALLRQLGQKEASQLARDLGQAVEEIAVQSRQLRFDPASLSHQGVLDLLQGNVLGARQLYEVGPLGLDLGSVALSDLGRVERLVKERAFDRAEAAALHLAERLKRATPSFSSSGGGPPGVESGSARSARGDARAGGQGEGEAASSAPSEFERTAEEVNQLAREGAAELSELDRLLEQAMQALKNDFETNPELQEAVKELKRALLELPEIGRGSGSASSEAAAARSQGEAMTEAIEGGELQEGVERGRDAERALERAATLMEQGFGFVDQERLQGAQDALRKTLEVANRALDTQKSVSAEMDAQSRRERAERQRGLSQQAKELAARGRRPDAALPEENIEHLERASTLLDEAARALDRGAGKTSLELAERAQDHLEQASFQAADRESKGDADAREGDEVAMNGRVPDQDEDRARAFRERVEQGLGRGSGRLSPAVRRYAEDLK